MPLTTLVIHQLEIFHVHQAKSSENCPNLKQELFSFFQTIETSTYAWVTFMLQASCWDTQYTEATCCPLSHGPEGNPTCWDGLHFIINGAVLPRPYFQDLSSTCVPQSSFVAVAATVLVSAGLLLVRPPFCEEKQLQEGGNRLNHEYSVDNAKFLTSIFFVLARICGGSPADKPASGLQRFAFTYHCRV
jgi:hypothetical protein